MAAAGAAAAVGSAAGAAYRAATLIAAGLDFDRVAGCAGCHCEGGRDGHYEVQHLISPICLIESRRGFGYIDRRGGARANRLQSKGFGGRQETSRLRTDSGV